MQPVGTTGSRGFFMNSAEAAAPRLTIGRLSEKTGCHLETIRYYERIGLMPATRRSEGGHRLYHDEDVRRLAFIRRSRELGFALNDIRALLRLVETQRQTCTQVRDITLAHLADVRQKLADLRRLERVLAGTVARCKGGRVPKCAVIVTLSDNAPMKASER